MFFNRITLIRRKKCVPSETIRLLWNFEIIYKNNITVSFYYMNLIKNRTDTRSAIQ